MAQIPYKIAGKTAKQTTPLAGETFSNTPRAGAVQNPLIDPPAFKTRQWRVLTLSLASAQSTDLIKTITGAAFWIVAGTNATDTISVAFNNDPDYLPLSPGNFIIGFPFQQLRFQWAAQASDTVTIAVTDVYPNEDFRVQ